jgi:hypothetical protein
VLDLINHLTKAQTNGLQAKAIKSYVRPSLRVLDKVGYVPIDKCGAGSVVPGGRCRLRIRIDRTHYESTLRVIGSPL